MPSCPHTFSQSVLVDGACYLCLKRWRGLLTDSPDGQRAPTTDEQRRFVGESGGLTATTGWRPFAASPELPPALDEEPRASLNGEALETFRRLQAIGDGWMDGGELGTYADAPLSDREERLAEMMSDPPYQRARPEPPPPDFEDNRPPNVALEDADEDEAWMRRGTDPDSRA